MYIETYGPLLFVYEYYHRPLTYKHQTRQTLDIINIRHNKPQIQQTLLMSYVTLCLLLCHVFVCLGFAMSNVCLSRVCISIVISKTEIQNFQDPFQGKQHNVMEILDFNVQLKFITDLVISICYSILIFIRIEMFIKAQNRN